MVEANELINEMNRLGVHFLVGEEHSGAAAPLEPAALLAGLAAQSDARMRLALIAVLLQWPEFGKDAHLALAQMDEPQNIIFKLYYTAAHYLQRAYTRQLRDVLGHYDELLDHYSDELEIEKDSTCSDQLRCLEERHKEITGLSLNWYGTYHFAAQRIISRLNKERSWATG